MKGLKTTLILMILTSLFIGIKFKSWSFLFQFELIDFPFNMLSKASNWDIFIWLLLIINHGVILSLPLRLKSSGFRSALIISPAIFVITFSLFSLMFFFFLIPFIILWIIALSLSKRELKN